MDSIAKRDSWTSIPMSEQRVKFDFQNEFGPMEMEIIKVGRIPDEMDERWFVFFESNWIYFHRSWTGYCVFQVKLEPTGNEKWRVTEAWSTTDPKHYRSRDVKKNNEVLRRVFGYSLGILIEN